MNASTLIGWNAGASVLVSVTFAVGTVDIFRLLPQRAKGRLGGRHHAILRNHPDRFVARHSSVHRAPRRSRTVLRVSKMIARSSATDMCLM